MTPELEQKLTDTMQTLIRETEIQMVGRPVVFVVDYNHEHGVDTWVCETQEEAKRSIIEMVLQYSEEVEDQTVMEEILKHVEDGNLDMAEGVYCDRTGESFEIVSRPIGGHCTPKTLSQCVAATKEMLELRKATKEVEDAGKAASD